MRITRKGVGPSAELVSRVRVGQFGHLESRNQKTARGVVWLQRRFVQSRQWRELRHRLGWRFLPERAGGRIRTLPASLRRLLGSVGRRLAVVRLRLRRAYDDQHN